MKNFDAVTDNFDVATKQFVEATAVSAGNISLRENSKAYAFGARVLYPGKYSWALTCTTAGTSAASAPAWPASITSGTTTLTDGTAVWTIYDMTQGGSSGAYLPLIGGVMTGEITSPSYVNESKYFVHGITDNDGVVLAGGVTADETGVVGVFGKDAPGNYAGSVLLAANNGTDANVIKLTPTGRVQHENDFLLDDCDVRLRRNNYAYFTGERVVFDRKAGYILVANNNGTSDSIIPSWPANVISGVTTIIDGTVTWTIYDSLSKHQLTAKTTTGQVDLAEGNVFSLTATGAVAITVINAPTCAVFTLKITNGGTNITWPANTKWSSGTAPTLQASGLDVLTFLTTDDGVSWVGFKSALNVS